MSTASGPYPNPYFSSILAFAFLANSSSVAFGFSFLTSSHILETSEYIVDVSFTCFSTLSFLNFFLTQFTAAIIYLPNALNKAFIASQVLFKKPGFAAALSLFPDASNPFIAIVISTLMALNSAFASVISAP